MSYNYQDASMESQQEYFGKVHTDNKETLQNALKRIEELEAQIEKMKCCGNCKYSKDKAKEILKENSELKTRVKNHKFFLERIRAKFELGEIDRKEIKGYLESDQITTAKELILKLYNAGRDVLMCPKEKKAYDNLDNAINDRRIEQFLKEIEK